MQNEALATDPDSGRAAWNRDGFVVVPSVLGEADLRVLRSEVDRLVAEILNDYERFSAGRYLPLEGTRDGYEVVHDETAPARPQLRMILPVVDLSRPFAEIAIRHDVTAAARMALGEDVRLFEDKINLKLPGGAGFVWHQDWSCCWRAHTDELVTCFIYLDDSTEENGCLQVLPGSHAGHVARPFVPESEFEVDLEPGEAERVVSLPLRAGDMVAFDPYLLHFSAPNRSDRPRRAAVFTYSPARLGDLWSAECHPELAAAGATPPRR